MKKAIRFLVDWVMICGAIVVISAPYGLVWGTVAGVVVAAYSVYSFWSALQT